MKRAGIRMAMLAATALTLVAATSAIAWADDKPAPKPSPRTANEPPKFQLDLSGDPPATLDLALALAGAGDVDDARRDAETRGKRLGLGIGTYAESSGCGFPEGARVIVDPSGRISVAVAASTHGQGHETIFAQLVAERLAVGIE